MNGSDFLKRLLRDDRGATAIEYGLILAFMCIGLVGVMMAFGGEVIELWTGVDNESDAAISAGAPPQD